MNRIAVAPLLACLVGCTPPSSAPPDALELTKLTVEELNVATAEATYVGAEEASVTDLVASSAAVASLTSERLVADDLLVRQGDGYRRLYGAPVGAASRGDVKGYKAASERCASAFLVDGEPAAHVCSAAEIAFAIEAGTVFPDNMNGAAYNVFTPVGPFPYSDGFTPPAMANDCRAWDSHATDLDPVDGTSSAALVLRISQSTSGDSLVSPELERNCGNVDRLACCR